MALRAVILEVTNDTVKKLRGATPPNEWVTANRFDPMHDYDEIKNDPKADTYKVILASKSEIWFKGATVTVTLTTIVGPVAYQKNNDEWEVVTGQDQTDAVQAKAVDVGDDGSVKVQVDGSRGAFRPPTWPPAQ